MAKANGSSFAAMFAKTKGVKETTTVRVVSEGQQFSFRLDGYAKDTSADTVANLIAVQGDDVRVSPKAETNSAGDKVSRSKTFQPTVVHAMYTGRADAEGAE